LQKLVRGDYNSSSPPSSTPTPDSSAVSAQSVRQKTDPAWVHVTEAKSNEGKRLLICNFCMPICVVDFHYGHCKTFIMAFKFVGLFSSFDMSYVDYGNFRHSWMRWKLEDANMDVA